MTTLSALVQSQIDDLADKLNNNSSGLTAEDQSDKAAAIAALMGNANWEQALIAIANGHLDTATTLIQAGRADMALAQNTLQDYATQYATMTADIGKLSKIVSELSNFRNRFDGMGPNPLGSILFTTSSGSGHRPDFCVSLTDFDTNTFYAIVSIPNSWGAYRNNYLKITDTGQRVVASTAAVSIYQSNHCYYILPFSDGQARLVELPDPATVNSGSVRVQGGTTDAQLAAFAWAGAAASVSLPAIALDPTTRKNYVTNASARICELNIDGTLTPLNPQQTASSVSEFVTFANSRNWQVVNTSTTRCGAIPQNGGGGQGINSWSSSSNGLSRYAGNEYSVWGAASLSWKASDGTNALVSQRFGLGVGVFQNQALGTSSWYPQETNMLIPAPLRNGQSKMLRVNTYTMHQPTSGYSLQSSPYNLLAYSELHDVGLFMVSNIEYAGSTGKYYTTMCAAKLEY